MRTPTQKKSWRPSGCSAKLQSACGTKTLTFLQLRSTSGTQKEPWGLQLIRWDPMAVDMLAGMQTQNTVAAKGQLPCCQATGSA